MKPTIDEVILVFVGLSLFLLPIDIRKNDIAVSSEVMWMLV